MLIEFREFLNYKQQIADALRPKSITRRRVKNHERIADIAPSLGEIINNATCKFLASFSNSLSTLRSLANVYLYRMQLVRL
jgi:hypothetical protein